MIKMKKHLIFRVTVLTLFLAGLIFQSANFKSELVLEYMTNAENLLGSSEAAMVQLTK